jgi:hypothetical protein
MTPTSDLLLQKLNARPLRDLPNRAGYLFVGVTRDGSSVDCHIEFDAVEGIHRVGGGARFDDLIAWRPR